MKHIALFASALVMAATPVAVHAKTANGAPKQSYCEFVIIQTESSVEIAGFCIVFSDGSY